jgi:ATP-dependent DNA ligase
MAKRLRRGVAAAEKSEMPGFIKPQLATLKAKPPVGSQWLHEIKYDGHGVQIHLNVGKNKVYTRLIGRVLSGKSFKPPPCVPHSRPSSIV